MRLLTRSISFYRDDGIGIFYLTYYIETKPDHNSCDLPSIYEVSSSGYESLSISFTYLSFLLSLGALFDRILVTLEGELIFQKLDINFKQII